MKIGILTLHRAPNVGAVLQAFALQKYLVSLGHDVSFIDYKPRTNYNWRFVVHKSIKMTYGKIKDYINLYKVVQRDDFSKCLNISSKRYYSYEEIKKDPPLYDITVVGSDQVWNFKDKLDYAYLLEFLPDNAKRIAYAPSMGQTEIKETCFEEFAKILRKYNAISCREKNGADFLTKILGREKDIVQVVDPTLLLTINDYLEITSLVNKNNKYIVSYILSDVNPTIETITNYLKEKMSCELINLRNPHTCARLSCAENIITYPEEWLGYMKDTSFVICSSFHATVFSLLLHKPFIVIIPSKLKSVGGNRRINSLLEPLGLLYRCVYNFDVEIIDRIVLREIEWDVIDNNISSLSLMSKSFLDKAINL